MKRATTYTAILCAALLLGSCIKDKGSGSVQGDPVNVTVRAGLNTARFRPLAGTEDRLERLRVLAFWDNGLLDTQVYADDDSGFATSPVSVEMEVFPGMKTFCVVANEPPELTAGLDNIASLPQLMELTFGDENRYNRTAEPLPMTLVKDVFIDEDHAAEVELPIARALGKVVARVVKDPDNSRATELLSIQVVNTPVRSRLMEGSPLDPDTAGMLADLEKEEFTSGSTVTSTTPLEATPMFLYEHYRGTGTAAAAAATSIRIVLEIDGQVKTYVIPLIGGYDVEDGIYAVVRNTVADLTITVLKESLVVSYDINLWDEEEEWDTELGGNQSGYQFEQWIEEGDYDVDI